MPGVALFLVAGAILGSRAGRRPGDGPGVHGPAVAAGAGRRVLRRLRPGGQGVAGHRPAGCTALIVFLLLDSLGTGAYQIAILSLIVTMLIGLWLVWPVSDRWTGSGELHAHDRVPRPPARRRPARARSRAARRPGLSVSRRSPRGSPGATPTPSRSSRPASSDGAPSRAPRAPSRSMPRGRAGRRRAAARRCAGSRARRCVAADARTSRTENPVDVPRLHTSGAPLPCGRSRAGPPRGRRRGPRRGCSRGSACRPAWGSRRRTASAGSPPSAAASMFGMRCVSGRWTSPRRARGAGDVEVAQDHAPEPVRLAVPAQRALERALRLAVGVDRAEGIVLLDRRAVRDAVDRGGRREHEPGDARRARRLEERDAARDVVPVVAGRVADALADEGAGGAVEDGVDPLRLEERRGRRPRRRTSR